MDGCNIPDMIVLIPILKADSSMMEIIFEIFAIRTN
jgi:hypothetical protein